MGIRHGKSCHVKTHETFLNIDQLCNGQEVDYFLDKTNNHNKTLITVTNGFGVAMAASNSASQGVGYVPYPPPPVECLMQLIVNGKPVGPRIPFGRSFSV